MRLSKLSVVLSFITLLVIQSAPVFSQFDELGLTLRPAIVEVVGDAGTTVTSRITIESNSSEAIGVKVGSRSLLPNDPEIDQQRRQQFDAAGWIIPTQKDLLLTPGQQATTEIQIVIPPDASPGGHYALITYTPVVATEITSDQTRVQAQPEVTSLALITVPGAIQESGYAESNNENPIRLNSTMNVSAEFFNDGNVHVLPTIRATIYKNNGDAIRTIPLQAQLSLPNTRKQFTSEWNPEGQWGRFYVEYEFTFGTPSQTVTTQSNTFIVLPPVGTLIFIGSIAGAVIISIRYAWPPFKKRVLKRSQYQKKKDAERKQTRAPRPIEPRSLDSIVKSPGLKERPKKRKVSPSKPQAKPPQEHPKKKNKTKIKVKF